MRNVNQHLTYLVSSFEEFILRGKDALKEKKYYPAVASFSLATKLINKIREKGGTVSARDERKVSKLLEKARKKYQEHHPSGTPGRGDGGKNRLEELRTAAIDAGSVSKRVSMFLFGLDRAGKTTLVEYLKQGKFMDHAPTLGINVAHIALGKVKLEFNDLGGQEAFRASWMDYWNDPDLIVFMVDASDVQRFDEARDALWSILSRQETAATPLLVISNKIDLADARRLDYIKDHLEVSSITTRNVATHEISIKKDENVEVVLNFIASIVLEDEEMNEFVSEEVNRLSRALKEVYKAFTKEAKMLEREGKFETALNRVHKAKFIQDELYEQGFSRARKLGLKCMDWMTRIIKKMNQNGVHTEKEWWLEE